MKLEDQIAEMERAAIIRALEASGGKPISAAEMLGIKRITLYRKMKRYGINKRATSPDGVFPDPRLDEKWVMARKSHVVVRDISERTVEVEYHNGERDRIAREDVIFLSKLE